MEAQRIEIIERFGGSTITGIKLDSQLSGLSTSVENTPRSEMAISPYLPGLHFTLEHLSLINIFLTYLFCPSCLLPLE